jgi:hypothetical protein
MRTHAVSAGAPPVVGEKWVWGTLLAGALLVSGCSRCPPPEPLPPVDFIAVSPAEFRSPRSGEAHGYPLPLDAAARSAVMAFLAAGGQNTNVDDSVIQIPDAEQRFGALLSELQKPQEFKVSLDRGTYKAWLAEKPTHQVIDARELVMLSSACLPYAYRASGFVWIFRCDASGKLGELIVQKGLVRREEL